MKKLTYIGLALLSVAGFSSCKDDKDPKIDTSRTYEFKLNQPQFATSFIELANKGTMNFYVSQPDYGLTVAPTYGIEISLDPSFPALDKSNTVLDSNGDEQVVPGTYSIIPTSQIKGVLVTKMEDIAMGLNQLDGLFDKDMFNEKYGDGNPGYTGPLYVRAVAYLGSGTAVQATTALSNAVTLSEVQGYSIFPSKMFTLGVPGNGDGWDVPHTPHLAYVGNDEETGALICRGFAYVNGSFKITDGDWDDAGNWGGNGDLKKNSDGTFTATLVQNAGNFNEDEIMEAGLYYFYVELTDKNNAEDDANVGTFTATLITNVSLPGDYNGWNVEDGQLTPEDDKFYIWSGDYSVTSSGWKVAFNNSWDINLGVYEDGEGENEIFFNNEGNLTASGSSVTIDLSEFPWTYEVQ